MSKNANKRKYAFWLHPDILDQVDAMLEKADYKSRSEFVEAALSFFCGHLTAKSHSNYLPSMFLSAMKNIVKESEQKLGRVIYKLAVELAIVMNLLAADRKIDADTLSRLRGECAIEIARLCGTISFEDAMDWQHDR